MRRRMQRFRLALLLGMTLHLIHMLDDLSSHVLDKHPANDALSTPRLD